MTTPSFNRVEIDLAALSHNYRAIQNSVGKGVEIMAVIKSDAYGHGLIRGAEALAGAGAATFGVAEVEEGVALRENGITGNIVVMLGCSEDGFEDVLDYRLQPVVFDPDVLENLSKFAGEHGKTVPVHVKMDLGMGRLGILPEQIADFLARLKNLKGVTPVGFISHFPLADSPDRQKTRDQSRRFGEIMQEVQQILGGKCVSHIANSAALLRLPETHFDMVRPGIALYGCPPVTPETMHSELSLRPVMRFTTRIIQIKQVPAGCGISYGHTYLTDRPTKVAVLPVGYDDGYLRSLSSQGQVLIRGRRAPVIGRICMNACMVDVTDIGDVVTGDEAVLLGCQKEESITADEVAGWMNTISYEVLCLFGGKNTRIYKN